MADRGGQYATLRGRVNQRSRSCSEAPAGPCDRAVAVCAGPAWPCAQRVLHRAMGVVWFGCVVGENACARIDPARQPRRCAVRLAIESQSRRDAMTSVNACASTRCTACMIANPDTNTQNRSLLHCANESRPAVRSRARMRRHRSPSSTDRDSQSNDRFKRRAGYPGTTVNSITRAGRRPWPGQYALPYIR